MTAALGSALAKVTKKSQVYARNGVFRINLQGTGKKCNAIFPSSQLQREERQIPRQLKQAHKWRQYAPAEVSPANRARAIAQRQ